jgi:hypothetical protein
LAGLDGPSQQIVIDAVLQGTAQSDIDALVRTAYDADRTKVSMTASADVTQTEVGIYNAQTQANILGNISVSATLGAEDNASGKIGEVQSAIDALPDGKTITIDVVTQYSTIGTPSNAVSGSPRMFGGVAGYAGGGTVIRAGEVAPEWIDHPGGGMRAMTDGLYAVPRGSYVNTAPASPGLAAAGGMSLTLNFFGSVGGSDRSAMNAWAHEELFPVFRKELERSAVAEGDVW